jgi:indole-3-glycerol phosphate synthase
MEEIIKTTEKRVRVLRTERILGGELPYRPSHRGFLNSLKKGKKKYGYALIAEIKPASPTTTNRLITSQDAVKIAKDMERGGASAISVITEPYFFKGSIGNLKLVRRNVRLPILRKDFIISSLQLTECYQDGVLLITSILGNEIEDMIKECKKLSLEPLVEVRDIKEAEMAIDAGARVIGINNRNLRTFEVDVNTSVELIPSIKKEDNNVFVISESGIQNVDDVRRVVEAGADGVLVGNAIMKSTSIYEKTYALAHAMEVNK